jgi:hypothetical protein
MPDNLPTWVAEEISNTKWEPADSFKGTGYFLDTNPKEKTADIQLYEPSPEGRYVLNIDVPDSIPVNELKKGEVYQVEIKTYRSMLSDKVKQFLEENYQVKMETVFRYELISAEFLQD